MNLSTLVDCKPETLGMTLVYVIKAGHGLARAGQVKNMCQLIVGEVAGNACASPDVYMNSE